MKETEEIGATQTYSITKCCDSSSLTMLRFGLRDHLVFLFIFQSSQLYL